MKKLLVLLIGLLYISSVFAISIDQTRYDEVVHPQDPFLFKVYTSADDHIDNVKIKGYIFELGAYASDGPFDLGNSHRSSLLFDIPEDAQPGEYVVRFSINDGSTKRIKHRFISVY